MDVPEATTPPVSSGVRFLGIARGKLRNQVIRGSASGQRYKEQKLLARVTLKNCEN
jgi:hypothetical protein